MITNLRALPVAAALVFALAACGGSSSDEPAEVGAETTAAGIVADEPEDFTEVETDDSDVASEEAPAETAAAAPAETSEDEAVGAAASSAEVSLVEWAIDAPTEYAAGEVTFNAANDGTVPHELVVIEGEGYEALPLAEGGAVIEEELPTGALIGEVGPIGAGGSESLTVSLAPGNYVLVCNLGGAGNSHAGRGQHLDITVS